MDKRNKLTLFFYQPSFSLQCPPVIGEYWQMNLVWKTGIKLHVRKVQGPGSRKKRRHLSGSQWALCDFRREMRTQTQMAYRALCETFGNITICNFGVCGCCLWPQWGKAQKRALIWLLPWKNTTPSSSRASQAGSHISGFLILSMLWVWALERW